LSTILIAVFITLLVSAFFSAAEIILVTANRIKLEHLREEGSQRAVQVLQLIANSETALSAILIGNNVANTSCAALATLLFAKSLSFIPDLENSIPIITSIVVTPLILLCSEIVPKNLGRRYANDLIFLIDRPLRLMTFFLRPLIRIIRYCSNAISNLFGIRTDSGSMSISREEFVHWMKKSVDSGKVQEETEKMIQSTIEFRETVVKEIMVPLTQVRAISSINTKVSDLIAFARRSYFTRYPVYEDRIDQVTGYVNIYDVLAHSVDEEQSVVEFVQPVDYVPNTLAIDKLFFRMQKNRQTIVIAVDEYGGCDGIVTIEDIMEELVGEIAEEHEIFEPLVKKISKNEYHVEAQIDIDDLNEEIGLALKKKGFDTLAGYLITLFERIPSQGDSFSLENLYFEITEMSDLSIQSVRIVIDEDSQD
tara:strand:- start:1440 stop:2708 length:1269 start_codon:yes stop_codon:yes gene_type:complete